MGGCSAKKARQEQMKKKAKKKFGRKRGKR